MLNRLSIAALLSTAALLFFVENVSAQNTFGLILGTVTDASGASVAGAGATLTNVNTGDRREVMTGTQGEYRFVDLTPGTYNLEVQKSGFKKYARTGIIVEVAASVRADISMEVGETSQQVEVSAVAPLVQTENATLSQVVTGRAIDELPLNGRNVLSLATLAPGVVPQGAAMGNLQGQNIFAAGNLQIGGGTANQSSTLLDGAPVNVTYGNLTSLVPTQDAIAEFRVQTSNNTAEFGKYTGGVINLSTKSGTNSLHGTAYEYLRNKVLNANNFFNNRQGIKTPAFTQNQFGGSLGGPIRKDKTFFFGSYEGFRLRSFSSTSSLSVPTPAEISGNFSGHTSSTGAETIIYNPYTTCGQYGNAPCTAAQLAGTAPLRQPFPNNTIPSSLFDPVANIMRTKLFPEAPNNLGTGATGADLSNYIVPVQNGGNNDQVNFRVDQNISDKQRLFTRFTRWNLTNLAAEPFNNGYYVNNPEQFVTTDAVVGDSYIISPNLIFDLRLSYLRFNYARTPDSLGVSETTYGFPSYMNADPLPVVPGFSITGYSPGGTQTIGADNNSYVIAPTMTWNKGTHQIKFGADLRRLDFNFYQVNSSGGTWTFDTGATAANPTNPGNTGNGFASFLLGLPASGSVVMPAQTASTMHYQGYFIQDQWQLGRKLTVSYGLRWEVPGVWIERYNRLAVFQPSLPSPLAAATGLPLNGAMALVDSPQHPERGLNPEYYKQFAPRLGVAYRLNDNTVVRAGGGMFYVPVDSPFQMNSSFNVLSAYNNSMVSTLNSELSFVNTLSNPIPGGLIPAPGRVTGATLQNLFYGQNLNNTSFAPIDGPGTPGRTGYTSQWNITLQHQFADGIAVELGYAGMKGTHLPNGAESLNILPAQYLSLGSALVSSQVANPFYGLVTNTTSLARATVAEGQLLRPFPQYGTILDPGSYVGNETYNSLQLRVEKRLNGGGTITGSYTFSKLIGDTETETGWLEGAGTGGVANFQNVDNMQGEKSLGSFDTRQRLVISYVYDLPFGRGKKMLNNVSGVADKFVTGWGINGLTTLQEGFPLGITQTPNPISTFGNGLRPNVIAGCDKTVSGSIQSRLTGYFNTACFSPVDVTSGAGYSYGDESRTDPNLRGPGIANWDFSVFKKTALTERFNLEFRGEIFNLFNRVQFGSPGTALATSGTSSFGIITTQANQPRLIQLALRLRF